MNNLTQKIPTLRITIALSIGILIGKLSNFNPILFITLGTLLIVILIFLNRNYNYRFEKLFGWFVLFIFLIFGILIYHINNKKPKFYQQGNFVASVLESPEEKANSYKSLLKIYAVVNRDSIFEMNENVLVYFEKEDHAQRLMPGNTIVFHRSPEEIKNNGNPYEFDYAAYLARKKIYRRIYLSSDDWKYTEIQKSSAKIYAERTREKLLKIYHDQNLGVNETEILSALTLGYKRGLDPETKRVFSAAGAMHVLAVSGLHVGILFGIFTLLFGFLRKQKYGKYLFILLAITLLWSYAFITGLSPSVMRAATMFSLVCIASNINRRANIYNSLAASAFLLLLINPNNLFEVGFQLSYAAVFGIVFLQPKLARLWPVQNKLIKFFWTLLTVSIAAQLATFPITSYYFNQFPSYFWLTNLLVIPAVFVLIVLGVALLTFSSVPFLGSLLALITKWSIKAIFSVLSGIEQLPASVLEINIHTIELLFLLCSFFFGYIFINKTRARTLIIMLIALFGLASTNLLIQFRQMQKSELIVYNHSTDLVLQLIHGRHNYVLSLQNIDSTSYIFSEIETVRIKKDLRETRFLTAGEEFEDQNILLANNTVIFHGQTICLDANNKMNSNTLKPDFILTHKHYNKYIPDSEKTMVITNNYITKADNTNVYFLREQGAFHQVW